MTLIIILLIILVCGILATLAEEVFKIKHPAFYYIFGFVVGNLVAAIIYLS